MNLKEAFRYQNKIRSFMETAQNILAIIGCQIIDTSGILDSKNIAGMKTIPDNKLFITNIDNPDNLFDCDAYFTKMILPQ